MNKSPSDKVLSPARKDVAFGRTTSLIAKKVLTPVTDAPLVVLNVTPAKLLISFKKYSPGLPVIVPPSSVKRPVELALMNT